MGDATWKEPQVTWYRNYVLQPDANVQLAFEGETAAEQRQAFENSLYKKIWNGKLAEGENYPNQQESTGTGEDPYYTFTYGINKAGEGCAKSMMFGITLKHGKKLEDQTYGNYVIKSGYLFIIAAYSKPDEGESTDQQPGSVVVRSHQLILAPNSEFVDGPNKDEPGAPSFHGIQIVHEGESSTDPLLIGIRKSTGTEEPIGVMYFPEKSYFLEGRHQNPVEFVENYTGNFGITLPIIPPVPDQP